MKIKLFNPHKGQKQIINGFADSEHKFGVVATGRQFGKSLLAQNLMLYWLLGNSKQKGAWVSPIFSQGKKVFMELLDAANKIISSSNKADLTITFINGSTLQFLSAERYDSIRGFSFNYMIIDEAAFIKEQAINEAIFPTLSALGKKCLIISTPKSKNWFYTAYLKGLNGDGDYISFQGISTDNPHISVDFIEQQRQSLPTQIFNQEYLAEFSEASNDVFTGVEMVCNLEVWTPPQSNKRYYFGIDTGLTNDYSVLTIMDESGKVCMMERINNQTYEQISNTFISILRRFKIHMGYVEQNGVGKAMFELIRKAIPKTQAFTTTNDSKTQGIRNLIYQIQNGELELPSPNLFPHLKNELDAYTYKISSTGTMTFNAPNGYHDDTVMSLMMCNEARTKFVGAKSKIYIGNLKR
jgi:hypothetical protein